MGRCRITSQRTGALNAEDRLELARLLVKAGYSVRIDKTKPLGKPNSTVHYVEFWNDNEDRGGHALV